MSLIDVIILVATLLILGIILFFSFYKGKTKNKCSGCPYKSKCCDKQKCDQPEKESSLKNKTKNEKKEDS